MGVTWAGVVVSGRGHCSTVPDLFPEGWHPGSLNLAPLPGGRTLHLPHDPPPGWGDVEWMPALVPGRVFGHQVVLGLGRDDVVEVAARTHLRTALAVTDGDIVDVTVAPWR